MAGPVESTTAGGVATLTLNRPERRNAMTPESMAALLAAVEAAHADPAVRVLVVTGAGDDFCVGADVTAQTGWSDGAATGPERRILDAVRVATALRFGPKPSVALIRGGCAGAGLALALACDLRYAAEDARLNTAFLTVGLSGDFGINWLLRVTVGEAKARELMLLPRKLTGGEALAAGLVHEVVRAEELDQRVAGVTARLAAAAPLAVTAIRRNLDRARTTPWVEYIPQETRQIVELFATADFAEARRAFVERRAPDFTGC
jgi:2-(1,2-epoxy-1,2-dihydrophenyl)acetyl-CoA isomerase